MATAAIPGRGAELRIGDGGTPTEVFTKIAEVRDINGVLAEARQFVDATNQDSPGGFTEEVPTVLQNEPITFELNFLPGDSTHDHVNGLIKDKLDGTLRNFQLKFPGSDNLRVVFQAYVESFPIGIPVTDIMRANVTLRVTGQPTIETDT